MKKKLFLLFIAIIVSTLSISAQDYHEMENMRVSISAKDYKNSRFIESGIEKEKEYIEGKKTSYNKDGNANSGRALQPYAEYVITSQMAGGTYEVTVYYTLDKDNTTETPLVTVGFNLLEPQELPIKNKLINSVKSDFKVNLLKGKNHTLKIWLPSQGVRVNKIDVRKKIINSK